MNPYDVLGVRPNASQEEIALAFKGRRSQYHPDRYTDPEGARWATQKMQEVNAAHAILSDPQQRANLDQQSARKAESGGKASSSPEHGAGSTPESTVSLQQALLRAFPTGSGSRRVFLAPKIPMTKLTAALQSYGPGKGVRDIVALVDTTVMGGAREGLMLTQQGVLFKELLQHPGGLLWSRVREINVRKNSIMINGRIFMECVLADPQELEMLRAGVSAFLAARQAPESPQAQPQNSNKPSVAMALYEAAKQEIVKLCQMLDKVERPGQRFIDREYVVEHFELLHKAAQDPELQSIAKDECKLILGLTHLPEIILANPHDERLGVLLEDEDSDSQLVQELRALMRHMRDMSIHEAREAEGERRRKEKSDAFFGRR